ncbi:MAG: DUF4382 domain-containing protein [Pseudomonadota bacterium]
MVPLKTLFWLALLGVLAACGGGSGGASGAPDPLGSAPEESGQLVIGLTDAEGDFGSYTVDVRALRLLREDGTVVEALPLETRVDFAELTEVTELLTVATVPAGRYASAELDLDFSNAEILVQLADGSLAEADVIDEDGAPLGLATVSLMLMDDAAIRIRRGVPAAFSLDFDLDASNSIDLTTAPPTVTVSPFLLASAELESDRSHRLRGVLEAVSEVDETVTVTVRPFRHRRGDFGELSFEVSDATLYEIDGVGYTGAPGLAALAAIAGGSAGVPLVAGGMIDSGTPRAEKVLAGSSVPWTDQDVAGGVLRARSGSSLTLSGVVVERTDGLVVRRDTITVEVGPGTGVTALGLDNSLLNENSLSIGQRVLAFGELVDDMTLDAGEGHVRMVVSDLTGDVTAVVDPAADLVLDLDFLNARRPAAYDFSGTGATMADDADPEHYQVATATLSLSSLATGDFVRVRGHVAPFGTAPADFQALSIRDLSLDMRAGSLKAFWPETDPDAIAAVSSERLTLDLTEARAVLKLKGVPRDLRDAIDLLAPESGRGIYAVAVRGAGQIHLYRSFSDFADEVLAQLSAGNVLKRVGAHGRYNASEDALVTGRLSLEFVSEAP